MFDKRNKAELKRVIFCFGEGGHTAQASRLYMAMKPYLVNIDIVTVGDFYERPTWSNQHLYYPPLRDKEDGYTVKAFINAIKNLKEMFVLISSASILGVVSTGPGFCVVICAIARLFTKRAIHLETWSRFDTQSLTGKLNYWICNKFYVQNREQLRFYKSAIYCGLL